jgi:hypothetical protein
MRNGKEGLQASGQRTGRRRTGEVGELRVEERKGQCSWGTHFAMLTRDPPRSRCCLELLR